MRNAAGRNLLVVCLEVEDDARRARMFAYLLRRGADPLQCDLDTGRDVITWAVRLGRTEQVSTLSV